MKSFARHVSLLLAILLCAAALAACGETVAPEGTSAPTAQTTVPAVSGDDTVAPEDTEPTFPDADYQGESFVIYERRASSYSVDFDYIYAESETGDLMNDQTLKRNQQLEEKYKIKLAVLDAEDPAQNIKTDIAGGSVTYDIVLDRRTTIAGLTTSGLLGDWHETGLDFAKPWWDANVDSGYQIAGKLYMAVNDVSTYNVASARFFYFNKDIVEDYKLSDPYQLMNDNQWTLDNFVTMVKGVSDIPGDGSMGVYGLLRENSENNGNHMHLFTGCGISLVKWVDGQLASNLDDSTVIKLQDITDKLKPALDDPNYVLDYDRAYELDTLGGTSSKWDRGRENFAAGHFLFVQNGMNVSSTFASMTGKGYGILPNPKYNTDQEKYSHKVDKYSILWAIPNDASVNLERLAVIMDYWAYASSKTVMPAFFEITMKSKRSGEPNAAASLDIVKSTICYELADLFPLNIVGAINTGYEGGKISSVLTQYKSAINASIKNFNKTLPQ